MMTHHLKSSPFKRHKDEMWALTFNFRLRLNQRQQTKFQQNAKARWPEVQFKIQHTPVQGDKAAPEIIKAIELLDANLDVDVIVLARGGGSFQDLLVFSDEKVVRAVANCKTPIVSAIGHENDRPLTDEVADVRASTPTDAAKLIVPDVIQERKNIRQALDRIGLRVVGFVQNQIELIMGILSRPILANPFTLVDERALQVSQLELSLSSHVKNTIERQQLMVTGLRGQVRALSPKLTLDRGYAVVRNLEGNVLTNPKQTKAGQKLRITLSGGDLGGDGVEVRVAGHVAVIVRDDDDLVFTLDLSMPQLALGVHTVLEALDGELDLVVPAGTQHGHEFVARGRGVPHLNGRGRGHLRVRVASRVPTSLSDEQESLLRQLAELSGDEVASPDKGIFSRIKSAFS
jgi:exonuclease VII large subunit